MATFWSVALAGSVTNGHTGRFTTRKRRWRSDAVAVVAVRRCCTAKPGEALIPHHESPFSVTESGFPRLAPHLRALVWLIGATNRAPVLDSVSRNE